MSTARTTALALGALLLAAHAATAAIIGPYTANANTLHLYHFDSDLDGVTSDSATSGAIDVTLFGGETPPVLVPSAPATLVAGFTGFGNAMNTHDGTSDGNGAHRKGAFGGEEVATTSILGANHATSGFTMEAVVRFDLDPTATFAQPMEIISGEDDGALGDRVFQWRLVRNTISSVTGWRMEIARLAGGTGNESVFGLIPTTGPDALVQNSHYHVAVSYDGNAATAGNVQMHWTLMDASRELTNVLSGLHGNGSGINGNGFLDADFADTTPDYAIGNELRNSNPPSGSGAGEVENWEGLIDEVRITGGALASHQMMFVPEPGSIVLAMIALFSLGAMVRKLR